MTVKILIGDVMEQLATLENESVDCVVTSPPYWGLRDYGVEGQIGLEPTLGEHLAVMVAVFEEVKRVLKPTGTVWLNYGSGYASTVNGRSAADIKKLSSDDRTFRDKPFATCGNVASYGISGKELQDYRENGYPSESLCGACRASPLRHNLHSSNLPFSGPYSSPTVQNQEHKDSATDRLSTSDLQNLPSLQHVARDNPDLHISPAAGETSQPEHLASNIPQSLRQPLDFSMPEQNQMALASPSVPSTSFLGAQLFDDKLPASEDFSDCKAGTAKPFGQRQIRNQCISGYCSRCGTWDNDLRSNIVDPQRTTAVIKPKDEMMMPNRLAIALQEAGWWVRSEIIWAKSNPMPESINDRPATSHEKIFLLSKSPRYFYDATAVRVGAAPSSIQRWSQEINRQEVSHRANGGRKTNGTMKSVSGPKKDKQRGHVRRHAGFNDRWDNMTKEGQCVNGRNLRNWEPEPMQVWKIATRSFKEAHFATFPPELAERCIKAGSSEKGCCSNCGSPLVRETLKTYAPTKKVSFGSVPDERDITVKSDQGSNRSTDGHIPGMITVEATIGWGPSCKCDADINPATILDPFGGAGTTGLVADKLGRDSILIELNPDYVDIANNRLKASLVKVEGVETKNKTEGLPLFESDPDEGRAA